ncbi:MAG: ABC transporter ATP-binding protein [bacterium]|nr:ABC transporter ATP-binding protein [bacterium]
MEEVCRLTDFSLAFVQGKREYPAVQEANLVIREGEMVALIGESGCGKTVTALSLIGLQPEGAKLSGSIRFQGEELLELEKKKWNAYRGNRISMIFQEPMTALNPLMKVGKQVLEMVLLHQERSKEEAKQEVLSILRQVGLPDVERVYESYPHQLSGGQRQRIMIAMAFVNNPDLLIADEPTTALDVTIQAQIMDLMRQMNRSRHTAVLLISHDLGVVRNLCSRVYIMYAGRVVESGPVREVLHHPMHPYTIGLAAAIPSAKRRGQPLESIPGTVLPLEERSWQGCPFANRCFACRDICKSEIPKAYQRGERSVLCHFAAEEIAALRAEQRGGKEHG